jgi:hypothetical protein
MTATAMKSNPLSANRNPKYSDMAWQGWTLALPAEWSPIKIEGDFARGFFAVADLERQRIGVRWQAVKTTTDARALVAEAMQREVGRLACDESVESSSPDWTAARLYVEPEPPGRDVWVAHSRATNRVIEIVYHAPRRDRVLRDDIVPFVQDRGEAAGAAMHWSVFWLDIHLPEPMKLTGQRLNVGDLTLSFAARRGAMVVRQIAAAGVALNRRPLESWLATLGEPKRYKPTGGPEAVTVAGYEGLRQPLVRRRRQVWMRWIEPAFVTYALRDVERDRLILMRAPDVDIGRATIAGFKGDTEPTGGDA